LTSRKRFGTCVIAPKTNLERIRNSPNACKVLGVQWPRMLNRLYCTRDAIIGTNADPLDVVETSGLLIDSCASCVTSVRSVVSTVRHRSTNFDTGAKVTRIWHPVAPVTSGKRHQRSSQREVTRSGWRWLVPSQNVLSLVPQSTVCTCNRRCYGIFRGSPLAGRFLSEESPGRQCYCEGISECCQTHRQALSGEIAKLSRFGDAVDSLLGC
jgi:hypothetical protein